MNGEWQSIAAAAIVMATGVIFFINLLGRRRGRSCGSGSGSGCGCSSSNSRPKHGMGTGFDSGPHYPKARAMRRDPKVSQPASSRSEAPDAR